MRMKGVRRLRRRSRRKAIYVALSQGLTQKRLAKIGKQVTPEKQRIIREGPFGDLLDIRSFKVPHELIEFVAMNTNLSPSASLW